MEKRALRGTSSGLLSSTMRQYIPKSCEKVSDPSTPGCDMRLMMGFLLYVAPALALASRH